MLSRHLLGVQAGFGVCAAGFKKELGDIADESMLPDTETVGSA